MNGTDPRLIPQPAPKRGRRTAPRVALRLGVPLCTAALLLLACAGCGAETEVHVAPILKTPTPTPAP